VALSIAASMACSLGCRPLVFGRAVVALVVVVGVMGPSFR